jgi:transcriptional regulator with XRE-family HTH domain
MTISPEQCRMARAGLGMTAEALAAAAGVSKVTLSDFEIGKRSPHPRTLAAVRSALEAAGVEFMNGDKPGVRLRKQPEKQPR